MQQFYEIAFKIDELFTNFSDESLSEIESFFKNKGIEKYFFTKLGDQVIDPNPWFKALSVKGYFNPNRNPKPIKTENGVIIPFWNILPLLKNVAMKNKGKNNEEMVLLLNVINSIVNYRDENNQRIVNETTDYFLVTLMKFFPVQMINNDYAEFIRSILKNDSLMISGEIKDDILPFLLDNQAKDLVKIFVDIMFDYEVKEHFISSIMDEDMLQESLIKFTDLIYSLCGIEAYEIALNKIKDITIENSFLFDTLAIDSDLNSHSTDYEYQILQFIKYFFKISNSELTGLITDLINEEKTIFKKLAIIAINENYFHEDNEVTLKNLFWNWKENPLEVFGLRPEIFSLFQSHYSDFTQEENKILINWIDSLDLVISEEEKDHREQIEAYQKLRWLNAVKNSSDQNIQKYYLKYHQIYSKDIKHPDLYMYTEELTAPAKPKKLCKKSNKEISEFLISLNKQKVSFWEDGDYFSLEQCIIDDPKKFTTDLDPFLEVPIGNQYYLLFSLYKCWKNNQIFEWDELIDFILKIINSDSFWENESNNESIKYKDWIVNIIADLIESRTRNDDHPMNKELSMKACNVLMILAQNTNSRLDVDVNIVNRVLNTTQGKIYSAMVNFSLSYARTYRANIKEKWVKQIKNHFTERLKDASIEFSTIMGLYLPNLLYLDDEWVKENINIILNGEQWKFVFLGYLINGKRLYETIYNLLRDNGFLERALSTDFNDKRANENIVFQIGTAFLFDKEDLSDDESLIFKIIHNNTDLLANQLSTLIRFCLTQKNQNYERIKPKIKPLWREIFNSVSDRPEEFAIVLSDLSKLLIFFDELDEELFNWMMVSGKYLKINRNYRRIIKNLQKYVEDRPNMVAKIFIVILENGAYPDYPKDDIKNIIEELYKAGEKELANTICNYYGANNDYFLKDVYMKYNFN